MCSGHFYREDECGADFCADSTLPRGGHSFICDAHFSLEFKQAYVISEREGPRDDNGETPSRRQKEDKCPKINVPVAPFKKIP